MNGITITKKNNETLAVDGVCGVSVNNENIKGKFLIYLSIPNDVVENNLVKVYISEVYPNDTTFEGECEFDKWDNFKPILFEIINGENTLNYQHEKIVGENFKVSNPRKPAIAISEEKLDKIRTAQEKSGVDIVVTDLSEKPAFETNEISEPVTEESGEEVEIGNSEITENMNSVDELNLSGDISNSEVNDDEDETNLLDSESILSNDKIEPEKEIVDNNEIFESPEQNVEKTLNSEQLSTVTKDMIDQIVNAINNGFNSINNTFSSIDAGIKSVNESLKNINVNHKDELENSVARINDEMTSMNENLKIMIDKIGNISNSNTIQNQEPTPVIDKIENTGTNGIQENVVEEYDVAIDQGDTNEFNNSFELESNNFEITPELPNIAELEQNQEVEIQVNSNDIIKSETELSNDKANDNDVMSVDDLMGTETAIDENDSTNFIIQQNTEIPTDGTNFLNPFNIEEN